MGDQAKGAAARPRRRQSARRARPGWLRALRRTALAAAILAAVPFALVPLYRLAAPVSTLMLADRLTGRPVTRHWIEIGEVAPALVRAVVASEDAFYCRHHGIDWGAVQEVLETGADRGASTIAMQTARNLFLWQGRSYLRKAFEVPIAYWADLVLGKRRLLEIYLNIAEWAPGIYGIEAAAEHHFGVSAAALTARQSALLAVTLPDPAGRNPASPGPGLSRLADAVAARDADLSCLGL